MLLQVKYTLQQTGHTIPFFLLVVKVLKNKSCQRQFPTVMLYAFGTVFAAISQVYFLSFHKVFYMPLSYSFSLKLSILYFHFLRSPILFQHFPQSILPSPRKAQWLHIYCFCSSHIYHCTVSINCNLTGKMKKRRRYHKLIPA